MGPGLIPTVLTVRDSVLGQCRTVLSQPTVLDPPLGGLAGQWRGTRLAAGRAAAPFATKRVRVRAQRRPADG